MALTLPRTKRVRMGFIDNVLSRPLVRGVEVLGARADIHGVANAEVAPALAAGTLDLALVPSIEVIRHPEYLIVPTICVGSFGGGGVAALCANVLPTEIQTVLLDREAEPLEPLLEVLLPRQVMIRPQLIRSDRPIEEAILESAAGDPTQAYLFTGLGAVKAAQGGFVWRWDLMHAWKAYTSMPFVLMVWAVRPRVDLRGLDGELTSVLVGNMAKIDDLAAEESRRSGLDRELFKKYYTKAMHYTLDNLFMGGLRRFAKEVADAKLVPGQAFIRPYTSR